MAAVNYLLEHMREVDKRVRVSDIEGAGIARRCEAWLKKRQIKPLPKPKVAEEILVRGGHDGEGPAPPLLDPKRKTALAGLYKRIGKRLGVEGLRPASD